MRDERLGLDAAADLDARLLGRRAREDPLERRPAGGHGHVALVARPRAPVGDVRRHDAEHVEAVRARREQRVAQLREDLVEDGAPSREEVVRLAELRDAAPWPVLDRLVERRRRRLRVALEHGHVVAVPSEQHRGGQAGQAGPEDEYLCHAADGRPIRCSPTRPEPAQSVPTSTAHSTSTSRAVARPR
jgi:hypothetical protein